MVELHDCFAQNEVISYEALGLCPEGGAAAFIAAGDNTYGGRVVTNPSGGLLSKGHPLGATGLAQCYELTHQLRGKADDRQVPGARLGLQHNLGLGGACVVTLYRAARARCACRSGQGVIATDAPSVLRQLGALPRPGWPQRVDLVDAKVQRRALAEPML